MVVDMLPVAQNTMHGNNLLGKQLQRLMGDNREALSPCQLKFANARHDDVSAYASVLGRYLKEFESAEAAAASSSVSFEVNFIAVPWF